MDNRKKYSLIIPAYNIENFVDIIRDMIETARCFEDILEVIFVDDGSKDNTYSLLTQLKEERSNVCVFHQKNQGVSSARNKGIEMSCGEYIIFADADDVLDLSNLLLYLERQTYICDLLIFSFSDALYGERKMTDTREDNFEPRDNFDDFMIQNYKSFANSVWNKVYKKSIICQNHIHFWDNRIVGTEDILFNVMYFLHCNSFAFVQQSFYTYYHHADSISHKKYPEIMLIQRFFKCVDVLDSYLKKMHFQQDGFMTYFFIRELRLALKNGVFQPKNMDKLRNAFDNFAFRNNMGIAESNYKSYLYCQEKMNQREILLYEQIIKFMNENDIERVINNIDELRGILK